MDCCCCANGWPAALVSLAPSRLPNSLTHSLSPLPVSVTVRCIAPGTVRTLTVKPFDGQNWEASVEGSGIRQCSKG